MGVSIIYNNGGGSSGLTAAEVQAQIDASIAVVNASSVQEFVSAPINVASNGSATVNSGLTNVTDVTVIQGVMDITEAVNITINGGDVTISSNQTLNNLVIKVNGN